MTEEKCMLIENNGGASILLSGGKPGRDEIDFTFKCEECACSDAPIQNARECNGTGTLRCGGCECNQGFTGKQSARSLFINRRILRSNNFTNCY